jgi:hypothetical protein
VSLRSEGGGGGGEEEEEEEEERDGDDGGGTRLEFAVRARSGSGCGSWRPVRRRMHMMRRLKSIASGRSSVSDPVRARSPRPRPATGDAATRIGCLRGFARPFLAAALLVGSVAASSRPQPLALHKHCMSCCRIRLQRFILLARVWH